MKNILLVDDEPRMLDLLALYLEGADYHCEKEISGKQAIKRVADEAFDLVLLDVMMPELDGWEVCQQIRAISQIPIIMLTARGQADDVAFGLTNGADDYVTKPFDEAVLLARIGAVLRRTEPSEKLSFQNLQLDKTKFQVNVASQRLEVTKIEFDLLALFLENQGQVFSREHLIDSVWTSNAYVDNRTVDSHIRNLRDKLREADFPIDEHLKSIYGVGYKWQA